MAKNSYGYQHLSNIKKLGEKKKKLIYTEQGYLEFLRCKKNSLIFFSKK
jgi:hypothetical protein